MFEKGSQEKCLSYFRAPAAEVGKHLAGVGQIWPNLNQCRPKLVQSWPNLHQPGHCVAEVRNRRLEIATTMLPGVLSG